MTEIWTPEFYKWKQENISELVNNFVKERNEEFIQYCRDEYEATERARGYK